MHKLMSLGCLRGAPSTTLRCALKSMKEEETINRAVDNWESLNASAHKIRRMVSSSGLMRVAKAFYQTQIAKCNMKESFTLVKILKRIRIFITKLNV